jgi:fructose-bisphosphate aldolase, class I
MLMHLNARAERVRMLSAMNAHDELQATVQAMVQPGKGILAADESAPTIAKRFQAIGLEPTEGHRRAYRSLILGTQGLGEFVGAVILFEETLLQRDAEGSALPELALRQGIVPGVKVDAGKGPLALAPGDEVTCGLDGLPKRLEGYKKSGARFAKWRAVYNVSATLPSRAAIEANAHALARYAAICQEQGVVPIVEPEVLIDGDHSLARCAEVTEVVLHEVFDALFRQCVALEHTVLKPSMVVPGKAHARQVTPDEVATQTLRVLRRCVPAAVASINFLSGGMTPAQATANLDAINRGGAQPWPLSFSFGRALLDNALKAWGGHADRVAAAQAALLERARLNGAACAGRYVVAMETDH